MKTSLYLIILLVIISFGCNDLDKSDNTTYTADVDSSSTFKKDSIIDFSLKGSFTDTAVVDTMFLMYSFELKSKYIRIHSQNGNVSFLLNGADVNEAEFKNFNWVDSYEIVPKGSLVFNNVLDGEIVDDTQIPDSVKIKLSFDGILLMSEEGGGGGIIYYHNKKWHWIQQD